MRSLLRNLSDVLGKSDPRWLAFGFNIPATPTTPGKPGPVTAQMDEEGNVMVLFPAVPLATRYRLRRLIVGVETTYTLAWSSTEPFGFIKDVLPGQTVQIIVQAVNGRLQGVASDPILFTIPLVARPAEADAPAHDAPAQWTTAAPSANGHTNGSRQPALRQ